MNKLIPKIDISELLENGFNSKKSSIVIKKIEKACLDIGFFEVQGHGIKPQTIRSTLKICRKFFDLPIKKKLRLATKKWNKKNSNIYRGYFPSSVNGKEGLDIGDPKLNKFVNKIIFRDKFESLNLSKTMNTKSISVIENYFDCLFNLGEILFKAIIKGFKVDIKRADKVFVRPKTLTTLRFNYYPKQTKPVEVSIQDGEKLGCETHVDSGIMTILYQDKQGGLQVQNRHNLKWHNVPFSKNSFVVNTGLALQYLTNNKFIATNHRVLFNRSKRISIPFFFEPSYDFCLNPNLLKIEDKPIYEISSYEKFLKKSLKKFVEYRR